MKIDDILLRGQEVDNLAELSGGLSVEDELLANVNIAISCGCYGDAIGTNVNIGITCKCTGSVDTIVKPGEGEV